MSLLIGYNTNGFAHHRLTDAIDVLAELGYGAIGITLDHCHLDPFAPDLATQLAAVRQSLARNKLRSAIETGARFLLDPRRKHQPTLLSADESSRMRRIDFLLRSIEIAAELGADVVSLWSGASDGDEKTAVLLDRLCHALETLLRKAESTGTTLAFEPEPGMLIDTLESARRIFERIAHPRLRLTVDVGHLHCQAEGSIPELISKWSSKIANVHLDDANRGVHEHLMFGQGEIDFPPILKALESCRYANGVYVELSRQSAKAVEAARQARRWIEGYGA